MESLVHIYLKPDNEDLKQKLLAIYQEELNKKNKKKIKILDITPAKSRYRK